MACGGCQAAHADLRKPKGVRPPQKTKRVREYAITEKGRDVQTFVSRAVAQRNFHEMRRANPSFKLVTRNKSI